MRSSNAPHFVYNTFNSSIIMDFITAIKTCFTKYFDFKGRARRSEY